MRRLAAAAVSCCLIWAASLAHAATPEAGSVTVVVLDSNGGLPGLTVAIDGAELATTDASGVATADGIGSGLHRLVVTRDAERVAASEFRLSPTEAAEILITVRGPGRDPVIRSDVFDVANAGDAVLLGFVTDPAGNVAPNAQIEVLGTAIVAAADENGYFEFSVPRGTYDLKVTHLDGERTFSGVRASPSLNNGIQLALAPTGPSRSAPEGGAIEEVVAIARYIPDTSTALERSAESVLDVISSAEISLAGDGDAAAALARVTGVTFQDRSIFVRGLGDRYSAVFIDGAELPSPDPTRRVIALDLFPSDFLGGIAVQKTYSPDLPGDFSGGAVLLSSKGLPDDFNFSVGASVGGNDQTTFLRGLTYLGSEDDWTGFDGGVRDIPAVAAELTQNGTIPLSRLSAAEREQVAESLVPIYDLRVIGAMPVDAGFSFSIGDRLTGFDFGEVGYQLAALYDHKWRFRREEQGTFRLEGNDVRPFEEEELQRSEQTFDSGLIGGATVAFNNDHSLGYTALISNQTLKGSYLSNGTIVDEGREVRDVTLDWIETQLLSNQLRGEHQFPTFFGGRGLGVNWQAVLSSATRDVLDRREYSYSRRPTPQNPTPAFEFVSGTASGTGGQPLTRTWEFLDDDTRDFGVDFKLPLNLTESVTGELKAGLRRTERERDFNQVRWQFRAVGAGSSTDEAFLRSLTFPSPTQILRPDTIGPNTSYSSDARFDLFTAQSILVGNQRADVFNAEQTLDGVYVMGDYYFGSQWRVQGGLRQERSDIAVFNRNLDGSPASPARLEDRDVLPAVNTTYFLDDRQQMRFGYSETVNRPQFRELSPIEFRDPETRRLTQGNPNLQQANIQNFDFRYEYYWNATEGFTASAFYKQIDNPIEVVIGPSGEGGFRSFQNVAEAENYGVEFDVRFEFDELADLAQWLSYTYLNANLTLIDSEIRVDDVNSVLTNRERELQGQSPWIVNLTLGLSEPGRRTDVALLFNMFGDRIVEAGISGLPDATERSYPLLDFNLRQGIGQSWRVGLKLRNLLDPDIEVFQGEGVQRRYKLGRSGSLSVEYEF